MVGKPCALVAVVAMVSGVPTGPGAGTAQAREPLADATSEGLVREALDAINAYRTRHHVPPVVLDRELVSYARVRARWISRHERLAAGHDGLRPGTGETLYWAGRHHDRPVPARAAVDAWYDERERYDYGDPGYSWATGHFTQLVWKNTRRIGVARVAGRGRHWHETYIVVDWEKQGNVPGGYRQNVLRP
jgi:uncharacterized protein YkwD